jgi:hypothetical protein
MFPYSGYNSAEEREALFWDLVDCCRKETGKQAPIIVLNRDTEIRGKAKAFLENKRVAKGDVFVHRCWAVDTCQMWLAGWGYVLDNPETKEDDRIVQLPGDIDTVSGQDGSREAFFNELGAFISRGTWDFIIGDFASGDMFNAKELIDLYGTYALMANWFPDVAQASRLAPLKLNRLRSEFINIRVSTLKDLLKVRKFAYEQTLNMLIRSWDFGNNQWKFEITKKDLGIIKDDSSFRQYRDCLDQIERTERMLKLLWREIHEPGFKDPDKFIEEYDRLDRRSTSIRENARIIILNLLELRQ